MRTPDGCGVLRGFINALPISLALWAGIILAARWLWGLL